MEITKYLKVWSLFNRETEETDFILPKNLPKTLPTEQSSLKNLPAKIRSSAGKIAAVFTLDRIAQAGITTCLAAGGYLVMQSDSHYPGPNFFEGALIATAGSGVVLTAWGMLSLARKQKWKGVKCLLAGSALLVVGFKVFDVADNFFKGHVPTCICPDNSSYFEKNYNQQILESNTEQAKLTSENLRLSMELNKCKNKLNNLESRGLFGRIFNTESIDEQNVINNERHITFGTTYIRDGSRDEISKMINANHKKFSDRWGLTHRVVDYSLLKNECIDKDSYLSKSVDCVPYWNKIALLRNWLKEPANPEKKEEWYIIADDDMPVTNMKIDPYRAIDQLRRGKDTSVIIAEDVIPWKDNDPKISVNTGLLFVRKDEKSRQLIEKIWERRNDVATNKAVCRTLGTCKNQDVLHEQEALGRVLESDRSLIDRVITVVKPRDKYEGMEIAINTFKRDGCFYRMQANWDSYSSVEYSCDNSYPNGKWRKGDWMGQTAGVPRWGWHCADKMAGKLPGPLRADYLKIMLNQVDE